MQEETSSEESSGISTVLWHAHSDEISEIEVKNPNGDTYTAVRRMDKTKTTDIDGNEVEEDIANYILKGYEKLPMNVTGIRLLASRAAEVSSTDTVVEHASADDLKKYGLDNPVSVKFMVDHSNAIKFEIGNEAPINSERYVKLADSDTVYTVSTYTMEPFFDGIKDYLGTTLKEEQADDDDTIVKSVRIERSDLDYDFYFVYDSYYKDNANGGAMALHVMEEPIHALLSGDRSADATHGLFGLTAAEVLTPFPKDADLKKAGLDEPFVKVTMKTSDGKTTVFKLGGKYQNEDGKDRYYGMLEGIDCIYGFDPDAIAYDDLKTEDIISRNVIDMYVWDIGKLICEADGKTLTFDVQGSSQDEAVVKYNGEKLDEDGIERYRKFYSYLLQTKAEEVVYEQPELEGEPLAKVHIDRQDGVRSYDVAYYDAGGMKAYIAVDGEVRFRCRKSYVDTLISNIGIYDDSEKEFTMSW